MEYIPLAETADRVKDRRSIVTWKNRASAATDFAGAVGGMAVAIAALLAVTPAMGVVAALSAVAALAIGIASAVIGAIGISEAVSSETGEPSEATRSANDVIESLREPIFRVGKELEEAATNDSRLTDFAKAAKDLADALKELRDAKGLLKIAARAVLLQAALAFEKEAVRAQQSVDSRKDLANKSRMEGGLLLGPARTPTRVEDLGHGRADA